MADFNAGVIEQFRTNNGKVGGPFEGANLLLLSTVGAKTGEPRISPVMYFSDGDTHYVVASKAGADTNPAWFHNLVADPTVQVERATGSGIDTFTAQAEVISGPERDRLFDSYAAENPGFRAYQDKTDRVIPIVALHRA